MKRNAVERENAVTIEAGPAHWQILQQEEKGVASVVLAGRWWTIMRRNKPIVRVRLVREGGFTAINDNLDWTTAKTTLDRSVKGREAGKCGSWKLTLRNIPRGGPYRLETCVGTAADAIEWCRRGDMVHHLGVGDVWLIAGQSNAAGCGRDPIDDLSAMGVHMFAADGRWKLAAHPLNDATGSRYAHNRGGGVAGHSPWLAFAKQLEQELGYPIGLIPTAQGGSAIAQWDPGQKGVLFDSMKRCLKDSGGGIRGCLWYQGESDVGASDHPKYKVRFARFLEGLRRVARRPQLPVITVQVNRALGPREDGAGWEAIRELQRQLSHELDGVFVIPIFEAGLCDGIHIGSLGNLLIAQRAAATALGGVYGRDIPYKHPECVAARRISGKVIDLRFDNVVERLDYECAVSNGFPFAVRDSEGAAPIAGCKLPRRTVLRILLARPLAGPATVTGAPGTCPPQIVPRDINGYRAMLGFTLDVKGRDSSPKVLPKVKDCTL